MYVSHGQYMSHSRSFELCMCVMNYDPHICVRYLCESLKESRPMYMSHSNTVKRATNYVCQSLTHIYSSWLFLIKNQQKRQKLCIWVAPIQILYVMLLRVTWTMYMSHELYICVTDFTCVPWLPNMCALPHSFVCHDSLIPVVNFRHHSTHASVCVLLCCHGEGT